MSNRTYATLQAVVGESIGMPLATGRGGYLAGVAINEEIDSFNRRPYWPMITIVNLSLVSGSKTYALSTSWPNMKSHFKTILLNSAGTQKEHDLVYYPLADFFVAGYANTVKTGAPTYFSIDVFNDLIYIDADPGSAYNARVLRTLYYRKLSRLSISTSTLGCDDSLEDVIVQGAKWRAMRLAKIGEWRTEKSLADDARREMLATPPSVDSLTDGIV